MAKGGTMVKTLVTAARAHRLIDGNNTGAGCREGRHLVQAVRGVSQDRSGRNEQHRTRTQRS